MSLTRRVVQAFLKLSLLAALACESNSEMSQADGSRSLPQEDAGRAAEAGSERDANADECTSECAALAQLYVKSLSVPGKASSPAPICMVVLEANTNYCSCFGTGEAPHQECAAISPRTGFCLAEEAFDGCTETSCAQTCKQPIERFIEESAKSFNAQVLQATCTFGATCRAAIEIDGNCHDLSLAGNSKLREVYPSPPVEASCTDALCPLRQKCSLL